MRRWLCLSLLLFLAAVVRIEGNKDRQGVTTFLMKDLTVPQESVASTLGQAIDVERGIKELIEECARAWNVRDRVTLGTRCFTEDISMKEPPPLPSMTLGDYLENLDETMHAMPDAQMVVFNISTVADEVPREGFRWAFEWTFAATFPEDNRWHQFIGRGQTIRYTALSVGTAVRSQRGRGYFIDSIRHYYSISQVLQQFTRPDQVEGKILPGIPSLHLHSETNEDTTVAHEWDADRVKKVCTAFVTKMYGEKVSASTLALAKEGVVMNRQLPQVTLSGRDNVIEHLRESANAVPDLTATPTNVIVDANRCVVEYKLKGTFGGNKIWGVKVPRSADGEPKEFDAAMSILVGSVKKGEDGKKTKGGHEVYSILRVDDYLEPYNFAVSMGAELPM